jgi:hypothetical protein
MAIDPADVRLLCQMVVFYDYVITADGVINKASWDKQLGAAERAALQRLIDEVKL